MSPRTTKASSTLPRHCFITIGATASFQSLLDASLSLVFLQTLVELKYTHLTVQCGPSESYFTTLLAQTSSVKETTISITHFSFNPQGLGAEMRCCQAVPHKSSQGVVISHAGAGSILDAMRLDVPLIVIPNKELLDNHQEELADELARQGYVVKGEVEKLDDALRESERIQLGQGRSSWQDNGDKAEGGIVGVLDEEMGFESKVMGALD